jgi:serine/threonine-protein kinase
MIAPGQIVSHYRIEELLGAGGMGEVFRARDLALGRPAALKLLPRDFDPALRARLMREAESCARLQHPAIATFFETGEADGDVFIAMEFVDGRTLRQRLLEGALSFESALAIATCLLEALGHAHAAGVLHRDVKPENIMLTGDRSAKLLDFGLAKQLVGEAREEAATEAALTGVGGVVGTVGYMSPEQLRGDPVDARSDLFQLGAVLYEALAGRPAFPGATATERLAAVLSRDPDWSLAGGPGIPREMSSVLARALARDPARRYGSAAEFLSDLQRLHEGRLVVELPDTLAVLDLQNLTRDPADDWLGSGIAESLCADLSRVDGLTIVAREKVGRARAAFEAPGPDPDALELALALGCRWLFSGGFQRSGHSLRVTTRLVEVSTGRVVAAQKLDGTLESVFEMQDRLSSAVASALNLDKPGRAAAAPAGTSPLEAFECYARGRRLWARLEKSSFDTARELYERAIAMDPSYAPALAGLAGVHSMRFTFTTDPEELAKAQTLAQRALAIDPANEEALVWKGYALLREERFAEALEPLSRAMAANSSSLYPHYFAGVAQSFSGHYPEAVGPLRQAVKAEPKAAIAWLALGWNYVLLDELLEAHSSLARAVELETAGPPAHRFTGTAGFFAECLRREGRLDEARERALAGIDAVERSDHMYRDTLRAGCLCALGRIAVDQSDRDGAVAAFRQALLQLRGRPRALGGGHLAVQALAGLARAGESETALDEALRLFDARDALDFHAFYGCSDPETLRALAEAALALGHAEQAEAIRARRREPLPTAPKEESHPGPPETRNPSP